MGKIRHHFRFATLTAAAALSCAATAQETQTVTVTGSRANVSVGVAGFGDVPLSLSPFSATVIETDRLRDAGIAGLGDITRLDAGLTDAYNAPGYWGQIAVRGFTLDNRSNFRRDGLPINAETVLPTGNKAALELLKGISGLQAGISAPGGLLNLVVKRPAARDLTEAAVDWTEPGTLLAAVDLSRRVGGLAFRLNAGATRLDPATRDSRGEAHLLAGAVEFNIGASGRLELEIESSRQSQPSMPGFSLLGEALPDPDDVDPRLNLNNQAWSLPVVFEGQTGSVRYTHAVGNDLRLTAHAMQQRLRTDDRIAFPFGCSAENDYSRYCSDGSFDFYDFRSEGERRTTRAFDLAVAGRSTWGGLTHHWSAGVLATRFEARFERQAYNWVGIGLDDGSAVVPEDPTLTDENTNRDERSTEWRLQDRIVLGPAWELWAGARHTRLQRASVRTNGSRATDYRQSVTSPWLALNWRVAPGVLAYASWGRGIETEVAPNRSRYLNAGEALPALRSTQVELGLKGLKGLDGALRWQLAAFEMRRPQWSDIVERTGLPDSCTDDDPCTRRADGGARHRGLEGEVQWQAGALNLRANAQWLHARREGAAKPSDNGLRPTNVPQHSVKLQAAWTLRRGLALLAFATHEGERMVRPDNAVATDGWTRIDLGLRYAHAAAGARWVWRLGLDNVADQRAWKESPFQFGHTYLYPLPPRTWRGALNITL